MLIAVYADCKAYKADDQDLYFIKSLIKYLVAYGHHQFVLIIPHATDDFDCTDIPVVMTPLKIKPGLLYQYRLKKKVLQTIKKQKADVLLSVDVTFKTAFPQSMLVTSLKRKNQFSSRWFQKLKSIFVLSEEVKSILVNQYKIDPQKIKLIYGGADKLFFPVSDGVKALVKDQFTNGKEYFLYQGNIGKTNNIVSLLKGFSFFKKRQKSAMKLVLMGKLVWENNEFDQLINTYKYREDIVIANEVNETRQTELLAAAYAFIQPYPAKNLLFAFNAMHCHVPVLACNTSLLKNIAPDTALFFDSSNDADIADKMMLVYKDEIVCSRLAGKGNDFVSRYNWKETTELIWQNLQQS